ncbi:MAG: ArnT family glycosyltransferase [Bacteroidota bacterium]
MKNKKIVFVLLLSIHITGWFLLKPVWPFSDDYCYCSRANDFLQGQFNLTYSQFQNRFGVYLPASAIFYFLGINPYTISLWPLIVSLLTISVVFIIVDKIANTPIAFISSFLIATNILQLTYAISLFPDLIVSFYCIAAILILYYGRQHENRDIRYPILFNIIVLIGFFTKETILLLAPFFLIVLVYDLYQKQNRLFWKRTLVFGVITILVQSLIYYSITGDVFHRIRSLIDFNSNGFLDEKSKLYIQSKYSSNIFKWISGELGYVFIAIMAVFSFFTLKRKAVNEFHFYITIYILVLLLEFITLFHIEKYTALFMLNRMWMLIIAPLSIVAAYLIYKAEDKFYIFLIAAFAGLCSYGFYAISLNRGLLFVLFLIAAVISYYLKYRTKTFNLLLLMPFMILFVYFIYSNSNYRVGSLSSGNLIKVQLEELNNTEKKIILCGEDFAENHIIYNGFKEYNNLLFFPFSKSDSVLNFSNVYVIVNTEEINTPDFITQHSEQWETLIDHDKLFIYKRYQIHTP